MCVGHVYLKNKFLVKIRKTSIIALISSFISASASSSSSSARLSFLFLGQNLTPFPSSMQLFTLYSRPSRPISLTLSFSLCLLCAAMKQKNEKYNAQVVVWFLLHSNSRVYCSTVPVHAGSSSLSSLSSSWNYIRLRSNFLWQTVRLSFVTALLQRSGTNGTEQIFLHFFSHLDEIFASLLLCVCVCECDGMGWHLNGSLFLSFILSS